MPQRGRHWGKKPDPPLGTPPAKARRVLPLMWAATRRSLGGDGPRPQPPLGSPGATGWPADGSGKWVSWIRRPVPFGPSLAEGRPVTSRQRIVLIARLRQTLIPEPRILVQRNGGCAWSLDSRGKAPGRSMAPVTRHYLLRGASFSTPCKALAGLAAQPRTPGGPRKCRAPGWHPQGGRASPERAKISRG